MLAQDKYQAVTNEIEEIQEVRKKVDDICNIRIKE